MTHASTACGTMILILITLFATSFADPGPPPSVPMDPKIIAERKKDFLGFSFNMVLVGPKKYVMPESYVKQGPLYYNFKTRPDDVYLSYFPEAGTLWFTEVVYLLVNNLDFAGVAKPMYPRVTWLEQNLVTAPNATTVPADTAPSPRIMQTNLPHSLIPSITNTASKIIYFARNPKDTIVAFFNNVRNKSTYNFIGTIDRYSYYFLNDLNIFTPYWKTVQEGFDLRTRRNMLFLYSEEDPLVLTQKMSKFLGKTYTNAQLQSIVDFMAKKATITKGTWKGVFSAALNKQVNDWISLNIGGLKFPNIDVFS